MVLIRKKKKKSPEELEAERKEKELSKSGIQDEFQAKGFELVDWVQHHKQTITIGLSAFALVLIVWGGFSYFRSGVDVKAAADYQAAVKLYTESSRAKPEDKAKKQEEARKALDALVKNHSDGVARLGQLYQGKLALDMGDAKIAVAAYKQFVDSAPAGDALRTVGLLGLAAAYDAAAEQKMALQTYETILNGDAKIDRAMVLWQAERLAKALGQKEKVEKFEKERKTFKSSNFKGEIPDLLL